MLRLSSLLAAAAALVVALTLVPGASSEGWPLNGAVHLDSAHFRVVYDANYANSDYISQTQAGDILGWAERAYALYTSWGYNPPVDDGDGDGKIDITVIDFSTLGEPFSHYDADTLPVNRALGTTGGFIAVDVKNGTNVHTVAHELFHLFQWRIYSLADRWLEQATAEWAAFRVEENLTPTATSLGEPDRTLDCVGSECGYVQGSGAGTDAFYNRGGNPGWSFFEFLAEKYGADFVRTIWEQQASDGAVPATTAVNDALSSKSSSLSDAFNGWVNMRLSGSFKLAVLKGSLPQVFASTPTGAINGAIPKQIVNVDHLAARYLAFVPGDGTATGLCHAGTLALTVSIPSGVSSKPSVFVKGSDSAQGLSISGNTGSITIPWSDCTGGAPAYLSLPNGSLSLNGVEFVVNGTLTIDPNTIATAVGPPEPIAMPGVVIAAPTDPIPPTIQLWGPNVIHVSTTDTVLRLIVMSDTDGTLEAALGSNDLGTVAVRAGGNDLRFQLPPAAVRRTAAVSDVITLRPLASTGYPGVDITRMLKVDFPPAPPKLKAKKKRVLKHVLKPARRRADHKG